MEGLRRARVYQCRIHIPWKGTVRDCDAEICSVVVLVQNHPIMVAGAGSSRSGNRTVPSTSSGARRRDSSDDELPGEADWLVVRRGRRGLSARERWWIVCEQLWRVRRLQRYWSDIGRFLQRVCTRELRERLRECLTLSR